MHCETRAAVASTCWYLAYTEPRRESFARSHLERQGYDTYLPLYRSTEALFPRYLFFRPSHAAQSIAPVRSTRGVQAVVRFGSVYAHVPPELIAAIRDHEALRQSERAAAGRLQPGQRVRVQCTAPALAGLEGLVHTSAARRVVVLMEILGRQTPVSMQAENLEVI